MRTPIACVQWKLIHSLPFMPCLFTLHAADAGAGRKQLVLGSHHMTCICFHVRTGAALASRRPVWEVARCIVYNRASVLRYEARFPVSHRWAQHRTNHGLCCLERRHCGAAIFAMITFALSGPTQWRPAPMMSSPCKRRSASDKLRRGQDHTTHRSDTIAQLLP
ncbi:hypothetical protein GY45DRAFT_682559 [Cubamyces sp. BRFM 1775]|nr:hypothetical protein GY45DRAFT_682559 [Cubamyces sp. BRFM 1775]